MIKKIRKSKEHSANLTLLKRSFFFFASVVAASLVIAPFRAEAIGSSYQQSNARLSLAEIQQVLAPIALYPDSLLTHILIASTYPLEVVQAHRWAQSNPRLRGADAVNAAELEGWDPSVTALLAFPDILEQLSLDLEWTQTLGELFLADEQRVLDQVQVLRDKAYVAGNLQHMEHVKVVRQEKIIYIEPAVTNVMYVPYYDTRIIFGPWWWPNHPPHYWRSVHQHSHVNRFGFYWGPRVTLYADFVFSAPRWHERRVVVLHDHRHAVSGPRFHHARQVADYREAQYWQHKTEHRRNIRYKNDVVRERYNRHGPAPVIHRERQVRVNAPNRTVERHTERTRDPIVGRREQKEFRASAQDRTRHDQRDNRNDNRSNAPHSRTERRPEQQRDASPPQRQREKNIVQQVHQRSVEAPHARAENQQRDASQPQRQREKNIAQQIHQRSAEAPQARAEHQQQAQPPRERARADVDSRRGKVEDATSVRRENREESRRQHDKSDPINYRKEAPRIKDSTRESGKEQRSTERRESHRNEYAPRERQSEHARGNEGGRR